MSLSATPLTLKQANAFISEHHRHHKPVVGHRFSIGATRDGALIGVCVVGRPVARRCDPYGVAEVTRLATDGTRDACSFLYSRAARAAKEMGFTKIQTYILESEPGTSLLASGWQKVATSPGGDWNKPSRGGRRTDQPSEPKTRWERILS